MTARLLTWLLLLLCHATFAQTPWALNAALNESVEMVPKKGRFTTKLETTFYRPDGPGPFPLAIINHGTEPGDTRFQTRYRPEYAVRYFLQRGYAVVVPMRQGFSKSSGNYIGGGCNVQSNGRVQADDIKAVLDFTVAQPWADAKRIVVVGQSHGGWTTLAFGAQNYPGVKALVNFAGGLRQPDCSGWERNLADGAAQYAAQTSVPSLWFYGDNDSFFSPATFSAVHQAYTAAGGQAKLVAFGVFGQDAHSLFGARAGGAIWQGELSAFLSRVGLPADPLPELQKFALMPEIAAPAASGFAALDDAAKVPGLNEAGRAGYLKYLSQQMPRAFAVGPDGAWSWAFGGDDPLRRALDSCASKSKAKTPCALYSVDDAVVWTAP